MGKVYDQVCMFKSKYPGTITWWRLRKHSKVIEDHLGNDEEPLYSFAGQKTSDIFDVIPVSVKTSKCSSFITDIESIRMIIRKLNSKDMPEAFVKWVDNGSTDDAFLEFKNWEKALLSSFGERKFILLNLSEKDIYK